MLGNSSAESSYGSDLMLQVFIGFLTKLKFLKILRASVNQIWFNFFCSKLYSS